MNISSLSDSDFICSCKAVTLGSIKKSIRSGTHTLEGVLRDTGATRGACKGQRCHETIVSLLLSYNEGKWS